MKVDLCKSCGSAFDMDEVNDGYCLNCAPDEPKLCAPYSGMNEPWPDEKVEELHAVLLDLTGDCV